MKSLPLPFIRVAGITLVLALSSSCATLRLPGSQESASLNVQTVEAGSKGVYQLSGKTNLPDRTRVAIAAVRYLYPPDQKATATTSYSILDYQETEVSQGQWQANLNLWQVATDGTYQEAWQRQQKKLQVPVRPAPDVVFLATLAPASLPDLEERLFNLQLRLDQDVRTTQEGDRYVQVSQIQPVDLPTGKTNPPPIRPEDINGGWGRRYLILPEPPNTIQLQRPSERQTNAPMTPDEFLR